MPLAPTGDWALVGHPTDRAGRLYIRRPARVVDELERSRGRTAPRIWRPWLRHGHSETLTDEQISNVMDHFGLVPLFPGVRYPEVTQEDLDRFVSDQNVSVDQLTVAPGGVSGRLFAQWATGVTGAVWPPSQDAILIRHDRNSG